MTAARDRLKAQLAAALTAHLKAPGKPPRIPEAGRLHWRFFSELSAQRGSSFAGAEPLAYAEIEAWARLNRWPLRPHDVDMIRAMDRAYIVHARAAARKPPGKTIPPSSGQAITPAAFDAVFG